MAKKDEAAVITGVRQSATVDLEARTKRYLVTMAFRTACFVLIFFVPGWWKVACLVGAALLPGLAVLLANAQEGRASVPVSPGDGVFSRPALTSATVIPGEVEQSDDGGSKPEA